MPFTRSCETFISCKGTDLERGGAGVCVCMHIGQLSDVLADMNREWGSLACPSSDSESFWNHEWTTHGTCSGFSQHAYFKAALNLYNQYDLTGGLAAAGTFRKHLINLQEE